MGRLVPALILALLIAATAAASGTTRYYFDGQGTEGRSSPQGGLAYASPTSSHRQREGDNPYVMRITVAGDTVVPAEDAFHLHLADHVAFFDGSYTTRVMIVEMDVWPRAVLANATFTVTRTAGESPRGTVEGWTDFTLDAIAGSGFAASGTGVLVPGGTTLLLLIYLEDAPGPEFDLAPARDEYGEVITYVPPTLLDGPTAAQVDEALRHSPRRLPPVSPLANELYEVHILGIITKPLSLMQAIEQLLQPPAPAAQFRYVSDSDASYLDIRSA